MTERDSIIVDDIAELIERARIIESDITDGRCRCPDEPHQNALHDLVCELAVVGRSI